LEDPNENVVVPFTDEEKSIIAGCSDKIVTNIDKEIFKQITKNWQKTAMIVGGAFLSLNEKYPNIIIPMGCYITRLKQYELDGIIEVNGDLSKIRFSEVRRVK